MTTSPDRARSRASRRLRHRSRSAAVSVALVVVILAAAYLGTEAALSLLGMTPLLSTPFALVGAAQATPALGGVAAGVLGVAGLVCLVIALAPGRLRRREMADERLTVVVDDDVVASGLSRAVATATGVARAQVRTSVSRRRAEVRVTPTTGFAVSSESAREAGDGVVQATALRPAPTTKAFVERTGVVA